MQSLTEMEIWELVDSKQGWAALTSLDEDGFPHCVPIGSFRLGELLYCGCRAETRKCRNIQRNPQVSLMYEAGRQAVRGVMFQGRGRVITESEELLAIKRQLAQLRGEPEPQEINAGIAYIEVRPERVRSWKRA